MIIEVLLLIILFLTWPMSASDFSVSETMSIYTTKFTQLSRPFDMGNDWIAFQDPNQTPMVYTFNVTFHTPTAIFNMTPNFGFQKILISNYGPLLGNQCLLGNYTISQDYTRIHLYSLHPTTPYNALWSSPDGPNQSPTSMTFGCYNTLFYLNRVKRTVYKLDIATRTIIQSYNFNGSGLVPIQIYGTHGIIIVYTYNESNSYWGQNVMFNQNLSEIGRIQSTYRRLNFLGGNQSNFNYDPYTNLLVRTLNYSIEIFNYNSGYLNKTVITELGSNTTYHFVDALMCLEVLVVIATQQILFYNMTGNYTLINSVAIDSVLIPEKKAKCVRERSTVRVAMSNISNFSTMVIIEYKMNFTKKFTGYKTVPACHIQCGTQFLNPPPLINQTASTDNTTNSTNISSNYSINASIQKQISLQQSSTAINNIIHFNNFIHRMMNSQTFNNTAQILATASSIFASSQILYKFLRPFIDLLEDLWFYRFHPIKYPQFINQFTKQIDILNQLRIKPSFLNYQLTIEFNEQANQKYVNSAYFEENAPDTIFMFLSLQDIYVWNCPMAISQFFMLFMLKKMVQKFKNYNKFTISIYNYLLKKVIIWCLIITLIQPNIAPIIFYSAIQFNAFSSFDIFTKINLIINILIVGIVFGYCFSFYPIIKKYEKNQFCEDILDISQYTENSFWLEMFLKCMRNFIQALIHGFCINKFPLLLMLLAFYKIFIIGTIISFRKCFIYKLFFLLELSYFIFFILFDSFLYIYTHLIDNGYTSLYCTSIYNFITIIAILSLIIITVLKIISIFTVQIYLLIKSLLWKRQKSNKITHLIEKSQAKYKQNKKILCKIQKDDEIDLPQDDNIFQGLQKNSILPYHPKKISMNFAIKFKKKTQTIDKNRIMKIDNIKSVSSAHIQSYESQKMTMKKFQNKVNIKNRKQIGFHNKIEQIINNQ